MFKVHSFPLISSQSSVDVVDLWIYNDVVICLLAFGLKIYHINKNSMLLKLSHLFIRQEKEKWRKIVFSWIFNFQSSTFFSSFFSYESLKSAKEIFEQYKKGKCLLFINASFSLLKNFTTRKTLVSSSYFPHRFHSRICHQSFSLFLCFFPFPPPSTHKRASNIRNPLPATSLWVKDLEKRVKSSN